MSVKDGRFSTVIRKSLREAFWRMPERGKFINDAIQQELDKQAYKASKKT